VFDVYFDDPYEYDKQLPYRQSQTVQSDCRCKGVIDIKLWLWFFVITFRLLIITENVTKVMSSANVTKVMSSALNL